MRWNAEGDVRMDNLSGSDVIILAIAAYVAIVTLVRLMQHRRDEVVARLQLEVAQEQRRQRSAAQQEQRKKAMEQLVKAQRSPQKTKN